ncbi:hypothetical protein E6H17_05715 [Candidatus Bathyarchaeota archaeon]|nr:MAG: hypothetical protein E6H17_05715 [Candidatus Bathyarchaeota archaeon]
MSRPNRAIVEEVAKGLVKGAKEAGIAIVGGETAIVPELLSEDGGFDLVGFATGFCRKRDLILGDRVREGDVLVGVTSSGIHSNGLSLARKILLKRYKLDETPLGLDRSLGRELLEPTRIYVKAVQEIIEKVEVHGLAHITGGGAFLKLERVIGQAGLGAELDEMPTPPEIFRLIRQVGRVQDTADPARNISTHKTSRTCTGHGNVSDIQHGSRLGRDLPGDSIGTRDSCIPQAPTGRNTDRARRKGTRDQNQRRTPELNRLVDGTERFMFEPAKPQSIFPWV